MDFTDKELVMLLDALLALNPDSSEGAERRDLLCDRIALEYRAR